MDHRKEQAAKLKEALLEHRRKMETDPEYRRECEEFNAKLDKVLPNFGNDVEEWYYNYSGLSVRGLCHTSGNYKIIR